MAKAPTKKPIKKPAKKPQTQLQKLQARARKDAANLAREKKRPAMTRTAKTKSIISGLTKIANSSKKQLDTFKKKTKKK